MSTEENKALARRFYEEVWNLGNSEFAYEVFAEEYVRHDLRPTQALPGPAGQKKIADVFRAAFPDLEVTVDLIVGEEDFVVGHKAADRERARCGDPAPPGRRGLRSKRLGMTVSSAWNSDRTLTERTEARLRRRWSPAPP
jgi:SnoaL-like polyketide cyclase